MPSLRNSELQPIESGVGVVGEEFEKEVDKRLNQEKAIIRGRLTFLLNKLSVLRKKINYKTTDDLSAKYLTYHKDLYQTALRYLSNIPLPKSKFNTYYWEVPEQKTKGVVLLGKYNSEEYPSFPGEIELWVGPLSRLPMALRAQFVDMTIQAYAKELLKIDEVAEREGQAKNPRAKGRRRTNAIKRRKNELEAQLLIEMCHSFREDYVVALAFARLHSDPKTQHLIGAIGAAHGQEGMPFWPEERNNPDYAEESSLATQNLLRYQLKPEFKDLEGLSESDFVEITRLHVVPAETLAGFDGETKQKVARALMYLIHIGIQKNFVAEKEICNTRLALHKIVESYGLTACILCQSGSLFVAADVLASIFGYYFNHHVSTPQILDIKESADYAGLSFTELPKP